MSNHYYADGAIHEDHHKEITINGNVSEGQLQAVMKTFLADEGVVEEASVVAKNCEDLCHFIHPAVLDEDEQIKIHMEIKNLVKNNTVRNICSHLQMMKREGKILLPVEPVVALTELQRMGMPKEDVKGFTYNNFDKCYRN